MSIVAENAKRIIREKGMKQEYVAKKAGLSEKVLSCMLLEKKPINAIQVILLAHALRCSPNELFGLSSNNSRPDLEKRVQKMDKPLPRLWPLSLDMCCNVRPAGLCTVPSGAFAGAVFPLYEMTNTDSDRLFRREGDAIEATDL